MEEEKEKKENYFITRVLTTSYEVLVLYSSAVYIGKRRQKRRRP